MNKQQNPHEVSANLEIQKKSRGNRLKLVFGLFSPLQTLCTDLTMESVLNGPPRFDGNSLDIPWLLEVLGGDSSWKYDKSISF